MFSFYFISYLILCFYLVIFILFTCDLVFFFQDTEIFASSLERVLQQ